MNMKLETVKRQIERDFPHCQSEVIEIGPGHAQDFVTLDYNGRNIATFSDAAAYERFLAFLESCRKEEVSA